jgi:putative endonuclease
MRYGKHQYFVYILTNKNRTVYYVGMTNNLVRRLSEHEENQRTNKTAFTGQYNIHYLLYWEEFKYVMDAFSREYEIKKWSRKKKLDLVRTINPEMKFLNPP